jgi:ribose-phosphate pyrophosphokinase
MKYLLTESVKHLKIPSIKVEKGVFSEGEIYFRIKEDIRNKPLIIISNITTDNLLEFLFSVDAAKRAGAKIKKIIIPFISYARQDKVYNYGESVSGGVICTILKNLKIPIIIYDIHSKLLKKYLSFQHKTLLPILVNKIPKKIRKDCIVIAPDSGGVERAGKIAKSLNLPLMNIKKVRKGRKIIMNFDKDVSGKNIIIVDDIISSGTTMVKAAKLLKKEGAKEIYAISTHGLFVGNSKKELGKSRITKIIVSNTLSIKSSRQIEVVGVNKFII